MSDNIVIPSEGNEKPIQKKSSASPKKVLKSNDKLTYLLFLVRQASCAPLQAADLQVLRPVQPQVQAWSSLCLSASGS